VKPVGFAVPIIGTCLCLSVTSSNAGPCTDQITAFEKTVRSTATLPNAGVTATQTSAAQLHKQPTPGSVMQAQDNAVSTFDSALVRAKKFDEDGNRAECTQALDDAKKIYETK
jgi:hypothetical protein